MENLEERHDMTGAQWDLLAPLLPGQRGQWGGIAKDNRKFINGVCWVLRTGSPWRDLPPRYGKRIAACQRCRRRALSGQWERIFEKLRQGSEGLAWIMIGMSHCKVHPRAAGARGGNQGMGRRKGG